MKIKIAALLAAILGVLGVFLFLVAFGTDYWLLVTEKCGGFEAKNNNRSSEEVSFGDAVYRGFWTALIVLAITASLVGVFLLVCGVPLSMRGSVKLEVDSLWQLGKEIHWGHRDYAGWPEGMAKSTLVNLFLAERVIYGRKMTS
ncbi:hypothetical protein E2320_012964, partial [Naja naja]